MIYFCDFTKTAVNFMDKLGLTNDDVQEIFNKGITESPRCKTLEKNGFRIGVFYYYDAYTLRYVIISVFKRPLQVSKRKK